VLCTVTLQSLRLRTVFPAYSCLPTKQVWRIYTYINFLCTDAHLSGILHTSHLIRIVISCHMHIHKNGHTRSPGGVTYFEYLHILNTLHLITITLLSKLNIIYVLYVYLVMREAGSRTSRPIISILGLMPVTECGVIRYAANSAGRRSGNDSGCASIDARSI